MADWYVSSAAHALVPVFAISTAYTVGQFVRRVTSTVKAQWVMRCTVAGTSAGTEPTWPTANNGTVVSGGATFANVTGQSAYGWSAAAGDVPTLVGAVGTNRFVAGDRMFVSSDHVDSQTTTTTYGATTGASYGVGHVISVNRAGSVPPVAADYLPGATFTNTGFTVIESLFNIVHQGIIISSSGISGIGLNPSGTKAQYYRDCSLRLVGGGSAARILSQNNTTNLILDNTTVFFSHASQFFNSSSVGVFDMTWINTPSALVAGSTVPSFLFGSSSGGGTIHLIVRGVDLSAATSALGNWNNSGMKYLFDSCRIAPGVTRLSTSSVFGTRDITELVNCFDGTNFISERHQTAGTVTTEFTITLSGGSTDTVGVFSHKMVSSANVDKYANPLEGFWMDVGNMTIGGSRTATVEIISSASLNNDDISLIVEYEGTAGSSVASFVTSLPATVLTTPSAVTTSTATWNSSPATPVKQKLQVTFTPQVVGRVRGQVRLGKASTTVYVDQRMTLT